LKKPVLSVVIKSTPMESILASPQHAFAPSRSAAEIEELLRDVRPWLYRLALAITAHPDLAEDAAQEALLRATKSVRTLQRADEPKAWLRKTTVRCALTAISRVRPPASGDQLVQDDPTEALAVRQTLNRLELNDRVILALAHFEELSYAEIASALEIPIGTVGSRLFAAREAFRKEWRK